jgi:hypothetical protein
MSDTGRQPDANHGGSFHGLDEATLLGLIEGTLDAQAEAAALAGLSGAQRARVVAMRRDRARVAALPEPSVPSGMVERAMAASQREALNGLRLVGERESEIPVSRVVPVRRVWWKSRGAGLAAAASLGLVAGVVVLSMPSKPPTTGVDVAVGTPDTTTIETAPIANPISTFATTPKPDGGGIGDAATDETNETNPVVTTLLANAEPVRVPMAPASARGGEADRALALAREGRLVIRVTPKSQAGLDRRVEAFASRSERQSLWRASTELPQTVATALASAPPTPDATPESARPAPDLIIAAGHAEAPGGLLFKPRADLAVTLPPAPGDVVTLARVTPTAEGLASLSRTLADQVGAITYEALPVRLDTPTAEATIDSALWWTGTPRRWAAWAAVPVIIER